MRLKRKIFLFETFLLNSLLFDSRSTSQWSSFRINELRRKCL